MTREQRGDSFGFRATTKGKPAREEGKSEDFTSVELLNWYGFLPELMGRFSAIACLKPLGKKCNASDENGQIL